MTVAAWYSARSTKVVRLHLRREDDFIGYSEMGVRGVYALSALYWDRVCIQLKLFVNPESSLRYPYRFNNECGHNYNGTLNNTTVPKRESLTTWIIISLLRRADWTRNRIFPVFYLRHNILPNASPTESVTASVHARNIVFRYLVHADAAFECDLDQLGELDRLLAYISVLFRELA